MTETQRPGLADLSSFGLTTLQSKTYQSGLQLGTARASRLARYVGIHRVSAHNILKELCRKGLANISQRGNTKYYSMVHPDVLDSKLTEQISSFRSIKPMLEQMMFQENGGMKVKVYQGFEGICSLYRQRVNVGGDAKVFLGVDHIDPKIKKWLYEVHMPSRVGKKHFTKAVVSQTDENRYYANIKNVPNTEVLVVPDGLFDLQCEMILTNEEHIFIASLSSDELSGIHIQSRYLYQSWVQLFDLIWRMHDKE